MSKSKGTYGRVPTRRVARAAEKCKELVVVGELASGKFYAASTTGDRDKVLLLLTRLQKRLLDGTY